MTKFELLNLFKEKIKKEYADYYNSLFNYDKSELLKDCSIEEIYYIQTFKDVAENTDIDLEVEYLINVENVLKKAFLIYSFDTFTDNCIDTKYIFHNMAQYEKSELFEKMKKDRQSSTLAERLDYFYANNNPYDRYDSVGSFNPEFDDDEKGLKQVKECLKSQNGLEHLREYLYEIIAGDFDDYTKEQAKIFCVVLNDYKITHQKGEAEL